MTIELATPTAGGTDDVVDALRTWQVDGGPVHLHPGDVGWFGRFGAEATAAALRVWRRDGEPVVVGLLDGPALIRLAVAPGAAGDERLARAVAADLADPARGVLPAGDVAVEARSGALLARRLVEQGWALDEPWTPLRLDLAQPVGDPGRRVVVVGPDEVEERVAVHRAAFARSTLTAEGWRAMAAGPAYADARCLVAHDDDGVPVAGATVWSAGPGRPGLLEPVGTHRDHRGRGHGRAITLAAAAALRDLGASSAVVCTPSANRAAVAAYRSAGFTELPASRDLRREG